ncbi:MAG: alpha/beta hydrolase [Pseudomonadota bacterium]
MSNVNTMQRFAGSKGVSLAADVGGDPAQPIVVLLHGGGQTRHSWGAAFKTLVAAGYHVINLESRGHGDSDWAADGDYALETLANDLIAVIAKLPSLPVLVGASMGGATALHAAGHSDRPLCKALVMVDVVPRIEAEGAMRIQQFMRANPEGFASLEAVADAVAAYYPERPRPKNISGLRKNLRERDGRLYWHWDPQFVNGAFVSQTGAAEPPRFAALLLAACRNIRVPTLLVRGLQSDIVSESGVAEFRQHLPQLEVLDVGGAGHMVAGDKNDAFNSGVIAFLQRHLPLQP